MIASRLIRSGTRVPINRYRWCGVVSPPSVFFLCRQLTNGSRNNDEALTKWPTGHTTIVRRENNVQNKRQVDNTKYSHTGGRKKAQDSGTVFLFDRNNDNPTQAEVAAYFCEDPDPDPEQVVSILQRTAKWKKRKAIDVLAGDNLPFVISSLQRMMPKLNRPQLRHATIGTLECLQVIPLVDIEKSGSWHSFI